MKLFQVDSFTKEVFKGNPAAVCIVEDDLDEELMQQIALEMNLSETAFVKLYKKHCNLRWFTPASEVPLCGHATLATAHVLWSHGLWPKTRQIEFSTLSGSLFTRLEEEKIVMDFPGTMPEVKAGIDKTELEEELGGLIQQVLTVPNELVVIMSRESDLRKANPNDAFIAKQAKNGVIVSARSEGGEYDFVSRYFAPNLGIKEDPVTGFMHTILTPYWNSVMEKTKFKACQASARGGEMETELAGERVLLKGHAVEVFNTELNIQHS